MVRSSSQIWLNSNQIQHKYFIVIHIGNFLQNQAELLVIDLFRFRQGWQASRATTAGESRTRASRSRGWDERNVHQDEKEVCWIVGFMWPIYPKSGCPSEYFGIQDNFLFSFLILTTMASLYLSRLPWLKGEGAHWERFWHFV